MKDVGDLKACLFNMFDGAIRGTSATADIRGTINGERQS